ncbi:putative 2-oxoadipate dehydrogenase complex component E1 homolog [Arctopsyche grandis]|uniref:putative 2-oxoadipate dehydrogenase complex component E1 homolog n=1 Tax=Arctopsyche grandis TaxID=121162 RepID=UPI00406D8698
MQRNLHLCNVRNLRAAGRCFYHSDNGVYGHRPKPPEEYSVPENILDARKKQSNFFRFVTAYRELAHKSATINPVDLRRNYARLPELNPDRFGLSNTDVFDFRGILNVPTIGGTIDDALTILDKLYSGPLSSEFSYLESEHEREWFAHRIEGINNEELSNEEKIDIAKEMLKSQAWDNFLAVKFAQVKRYGGEGAESMMAFFTELFKLTSKDTIETVVLGMPHRGKLNLLTGLLQCPPNKIFMKYRGIPEFPASTKAMCDIPNHYSVSIDVNQNGKQFHLAMLNNPSHLEVVNPISMGKARAKQQFIKEGDYSDDVNSKLGDKVLNIQLHGDAAFIGQGINQECLMLAQTPNFDIGGTIHMIINNQIGFTTPGERGRSCRYASDLAKSINSPVIHVNGDYPELVLKATRIAFEYQRQFRKDIFIDFNCFRRWGHNEMDDPTFTNPLLYKIIQNRKSVPDLYAEKLVAEGVLTGADVKTIISEHMNWLTDELKSLDKYEPDLTYFQKQWSKIVQAPSAIEIWDTGYDVEQLKLIGEKSVQYPSDFVIHPHLLKNHVNARLSKVSNGANLDWATAEALAIGSLLLQGHHVRISGEDVGRGTFSNRHAMLVDQETNDIFIPLNGIKEDQEGLFEVANSILSEEAVLGYEYGMAIDQPNNLYIWESQFGDFFNGAQIIFDTYIASGETKWMKSNGLVVLLPHGYDGAGAEHSSSRMERFLQLTDSKENAPDGDDINMQIVNPTTPAQYFHLLRRQLVRNYRKPLIIISPKTLLRLSEATSTLKDMAPGTHFLPVIGDDSVNASKVSKVIFVSGKHYYALVKERSDKKIQDVAIIRLESLCPFPLVNIQQELAKYKNARTFIWSQEEHRNMGAWTFVKPRFENLAGRKLTYCGRDTAACPAVGVGSRHREEAVAVVEEPFKIK